MSRRSKKNEKNSVKILPISIILFLIIAIITAFIILNKGKIAGYSLVKVQTQGEEVLEEEQEPEDKMEISSEKKYLSSKKKEESALTVTINDEEVDINDVELESSNEDAIKIKDGVAVAVSPGKSTITARKDDLESTIDIRSIIPITSMTFTTTNTTIRVGKSLQMKLVAKPSDANIETLKYTSSNEKVATVNSNGIVTGVAPGKVKITVTDSYTETEKSVNLTIMK